jgi:hypothetical protein
MRSNRTKTTPVFCWSCVSVAVFVTVALIACPVYPQAADEPFTHPGILHSRAELDFVRAKVAAGEEPWQSAWEELRSHAISKLDWKPRPAADVVRRAYNNPDIGGTDLMRDAAAAYSHAIQWYVTGEPPHADKAIEILNAYATTLRSVGGHDAKLLVGMVGINFANAAEIIHHTQAGWKDRDQQQFEHLYRSYAGRYNHPAISDKARGRFSSIYERVYHHYHDRMGLEMPFTGQVVEQHRPERWQIA